MPRPNNNTNNNNNTQVILKNGKRVPYGLCFWAGGTEPRPLTKRLIETIGSEQTDAEGSKRGQITVDGCAPFRQTI